MAAAGQGSPPKPAQSTHQCFETERCQLMPYDLPTKVVDVILTARRPSMKSVYARPWHKFVAWCGILRTDPLQVNLLDILLFVFSSAQQWALFKGILAEGPLRFFAFSDQLSLVKSPVVMWFIKCLTHMYPPKPYVMPQWILNRS